MKPTLAELAKRTEPLNAKEVEVASRLIVALCDDSKSDALAVIQRAEEASKRPQVLHQIHMHIEHFMGMEKAVERKLTPPKG